MSVYSVYFSPTGGVARVMNILGEALSTEREIDLSCTDASGHKETFHEDDICLIGVPSYGGRVPQLALEKIKEMKGGGAAAVAVVVYGNRAYDDTLLELKRGIADSGFHVSAAVAAVAEHSIMRQFGAGRPDECDRQELTAFAAAIKEALAATGKTDALAVPGNEPYREYHGVPFTPQADKKCSGCGVCARRCPAGAISIENPAVTDKEKCISCMRCVAICPQKARGINKLVLTAAAHKMKKVCQTRNKNELFL